MKQFINYNKISFVPISALKKENVISSLEEYEETFCETLIRVTQ